MSEPDPISSDATEPRLSLRVVTMPRDTNPHGTIFGGVIMSYIDQAGMVEALHHANCTWVTASIERIDFSAPVHLGDIVSFYTRTERTGRSSVRIRVEVESERRDTAERVSVTSATLTMVALGYDGKPMPYNEAPPAQLFRPLAPALQQTGQRPVSGGGA